jgi:ribose transport system ATP-binding protein
MLARWIFNNSDILIFDEPTRGIDVNSKVEVYKLMGSFINKGGAIVIISSEVQELEGICDRALVLQNGSVVAELKGPDLKQETITYHSVVSKGSA